MQGIGGALVAVHPKDLEDSCDQDYRRQCPLEAGRNWQWRGSLAL